MWALRQPSSSPKHGAFCGTYPLLRAEIVLVECPFGTHVEDRWPGSGNERWRIRASFFVDFSIYLSGLKRSRLLPLTFCM